MENPEHYLIAVTISTKVDRSIFRTAESPDSEDSEEGQSNQDDGNTEPAHSGSTTVTTSTISTARREGSNIRRSRP